MKLTQNKSNTLVSVVLAAYNGEKFIQEQINSIFDQSYKYIELIIVDDCSTDQTKNSLISLKERYKDKNIKIFFNRRNVGFVKNFEIALMRSNGNYIALCDQDDIWIQNKIERLLDEIGSYSLIYSDVSLVDSDNNILVASRDAFYEVKNRSNIFFKELIYKNYIIGCSAMFSKQLLNIVLPIPNNVSFHDWWISICASKANGIKYLNEPLVLYRQHDNNVHGCKQNIIFEKILNKNNFAWSFNSNKLNEIERNINMIKIFDKNFNRFKLNSKDKRAISIADAYYKSYSRNRLQYWFLTFALFRQLSTKKTIFSYWRVFKNCKKKM